MLLLLYALKAVAGSCFLAPAPTAGAGEMAISGGSAAASIGY
jgi:hypothetical protein